jgi:glycosyltransferase involved in cell wall biosynthesis
MKSYNIENIDLLILGQEKNSQTERLENFFKSKFNKIIVISFSNIFEEKAKISLKKYVNDKIVSVDEFAIKYVNNKNEIFILINFFQLFIQINRILKNKKIKIAIGIALFSSAICFYLKIRRRLNKYIYFCLDYYKPNNRIINKIYVFFTHLLDVIVAYYSNKIWSISYRLAKLRNPSNLNRSLIVPNGCVKNNKTKNYNFSSKKIVFVGTISENQALLQLCEILKKLNRRLGVTLDIVGSGPYKGLIEKKVLQLKLGNIVKFHGFIESNDELNLIIQNAAICFSVWTKAIDDNSSLADPGKPKLYTSQNRPMIISENVYISKFIKKFDAGLVVNSTKKEMYKALKVFFSSKSRRKKILKNVEIIKKMWESEKILNRAFNNINLIKQ